MAKPLTSVFVAFEAVPFAKVGGLADVAGALPHALADLGVQTTLIVPRFGHIDPASFGAQEIPIPADWYVGINWKHYPFKVWKARQGQVDVYMLGDDHFYGRHGIYNDPNGWPFMDELERYVFFAKGSVELMKCLGLQPDIVHINDFQTALVAAYLRQLYPFESNFHRAAVLYSIHNLAHQGTYSPEGMTTIGFDPRLFFPMSPFELHGALNLMKVGIHFSDIINTVSPTYAREIQSSEGGAGLDGVLRHFHNKLHGVLNGIDTRVWNPALDKHIPIRYDAAGRVEGKRACKANLLERAHIPMSRLDKPLVGMVGRLVPQKGVDLVEGMIEDLMRADVNFVALGSGSSDYENALRAAAHRHPDRVGISIGFDNALAHQITAGSDMFLMPSRYEPCGLNQMYSMAYGTIPIVRRTGGLADTVSEWNPWNRSGTGFVFDHASSGELLDASWRAIHNYWNPTHWQRLTWNAMTQDFSWRNSAAHYLSLYHQAIENRRRYIGG